MLWTKLNEERLKKRQMNKIFYEKCRSRGGIIGIRPGLTPG